MTADERLARIRAKVTRAKQHIQDFQLALRAFYESKPYKVGCQEDVQAGQRIYYVAKVDSVPDSLTAIAADVVHNLRSPLDHIAYQLVVDARGGAEPDWIVYYPISGRAADYPATCRGKIKGVRQEIIDAIDATEPYKGGNGHALWQLNELDKPDKHKLLISTGIFSSGVDLSPILKEKMKEILISTADTCPPEIVDQLTPLFIRELSGQFVPLNVGDKLYSEPLNHKVYYDRSFAFNVAFDAPGVIGCEPAIKTLQDMANLVDNIIMSLGRFLQ